MIRYLLDTNICIELLRESSPAARERLRNSDLNEVGISTVTLGELEYGASCSRDPEKGHRSVGEFCASLQVLPFSDSAAAYYGNVRADLRRRGESIGPLDTLIAGHALSLDATIVTNNEREFRRVRGLRIENWLH